MEWKHGIHRRLGSGNGIGRVGVHAACGQGNIHGLGVLIHYHILILEVDDDITAVLYGTGAVGRR